MSNPSWQRLLAASFWTTILSHHSISISSFVSRYDLLSTNMTFWCNDCDALMFIYLSIHPSIYLSILLKYGLPPWLSSKKSTCNADVGSIHWVGKIPWRSVWQSSPVFLPGESHGWRSLVGYSPYSHKELDRMEATEHACMQIHVYYMLLLLLSCFSCIQLCATPWMAAHQAPLSLGFSREEHWSGCITYIYI